MTPEEKNIYNYKSFEQLHKIIIKYRNYESNTQKAKAAKAKNEP